MNAPVTAAATSAARTARLARRTTTRSFHLLQLQGEVERKFYLLMSLLTASPEEVVVVGAPCGVQIRGYKVKTRAPISTATSCTNL